MRCGCAVPPEMSTRRSAGATEEGSVVGVVAPLGPPPPLLLVRLLVRGICVLSSAEGRLCWMRGGLSCFGAKPSSEVEICHQR